MGGTIYAETSDTAADAAAWSALGQTAAAARLQDASVTAAAAAPALHFEQQLDHFNSSEARTWRQVYWVCGDAFPKTAQEQEESGVIYMFLGNESPLGTPQQPIVFENARRQRALVVLVEHRYYGASIPVPVNKSGTLPAADFKWLTIQQVIEDTAAVLRHVRADRSIPNAVPAVVIGGSAAGSWQHTIAWSSRQSLPQQ
ncbi:hypothetical protein OEZ86_012824 [Tetradesmus obliquus]|nr:hypothetical protein OEZ86_012824 [Tetradesmus obliquus]